MEIEMADGWLLFTLWTAVPTPKDIMGVADHLMRMMPEYREWKHACAALGERGLIAPGDFFPVVTDLGDELVDKHKRSTGYEWIRSITRALVLMPIIADPIPPPDEEAYYAMLRSWGWSK